MQQWYGLLPRIPISTNPNRNDIWRSMCHNERSVLLCPPNGDHLPFDCNRVDEKMAIVASLLRNRHSVSPRLRDHTA